MDANFKLEGFETVKKNVRNLPGRLYPDVKKVFQKFAFDLQRVMVIQTKGGALKSRSGALSKGWRPEVGGFNLKTLFSQVSNSVPYAVIHQFGGIVRAVKSKYLTIPLPAMKTASGVARMSARQAIESRKTFFGKSKNGNLILFENRPKTNGGKPRPPLPLFVLKKQVKIPKRLSFFETAERLGKRALVELAKVVNRG